MVGVAIGNAQSCTNSHEITSERRSRVQIGDFVKGIVGSPYGTTNEQMTRGVVRDVSGEKITVRILDHENGDKGVFDVEAKYFEVIGHAKPFVRAEVIALLAQGKSGALMEYDLSRADLSGADLSRADLSGANLSRADLSRADLSDANLSDANLSDANLSRADLSDANLSDANLSDADLSGANLSRANLSDAKELLSAINYMEAHFERTDRGYIAYKTFGANYTPPQKWAIAPESIIDETVNPDRGTTCGSGINVAPLNWVKHNAKGNRRDVWKVLIEWAWLPGVVVPFRTDGKIRCERVRLLEIVK